MLKRIGGNLLTALISSILIGIGLVAWEKATDGSLIRWLGGAVIEDITKLKTRRLQCEAHPVEEFQPTKQCEAGQFKLVEWCSGDCNKDDARVTICCSQ